MESSGSFTGYRLTGLVLIFAFVLAAIGAVLPYLGGNGNTSIYELAAPDNLQAVAAELTLWRWTNVVWGVAALALLAGLSMLTMLLEAKERVFSRLGLIGFLVAAVLWLIFSAFRGVLTVQVAQEMTTAGAAPAYYAPLAQWMFAVFFIYAALGFLALAAYGVSLLQARWLPGWVGWATLLFSIAMLIVLFVQGDNLPAFHYLPGLLIGGLLLFRK